MTATTPKRRTNKKTEAVVSNVTTNEEIEKMIAEASQADASAPSAPSIIVPDSSAPVSDKPEVIGSTFDDEDDRQAGETIAIACNLPNGLEFDDVVVNGRTKTIILPGINSNLRGAKTGVLALPGNALCVQLPKEDWEALLRTHGREIAFTGRDGHMPCVYPVGDKAGFRAASSEIKEMRNGLEAADPYQIGVKEQSNKGM